MISLIVPSYRNPKCLDICIQSAIRGQKFNNEIICIIDGFPEEYEDLMIKYEDDVNFLPLEENKGMQYALNVGVWQANSEKILIVNDDNVLCKDWDSILEDDYDDNLIITPNQIEKAESLFDFVVKDYGTPETFDLDNFLETEPDHRTDKYTQKGGIFPLFLSKRIYMMVGGFDDLYPSPFVCDWDFFLKCELAKVKTIRTHKLNFYHFGSVSTKNGKESKRFTDSESEAYELYQYKWGMPMYLNPDNTHSSKHAKVRGITFG
tara:strand:+ start:6871 stop:7659 length:789 start_codon:yes stop_codon:yes gene_type:complete